MHYGNTKANTHTVSFRNSVTQDTGSSLLSHFSYYSISRLHLTFINGNLSLVYYELGRYAIFLVLNCPLPRILTRNFTYQPILSKSASMMLGGLYHVRQYFFLILCWALNGQCLTCIVKGVWGSWGNAFNYTALIKMMESKVFISLTSKNIPHALWREEGSSSIHTALQRWWNQKLFISLTPII